MKEQAARTWEHCLEILEIFCCEKIQDNNFRKSAHWNLRFRSANGQDNALFIANRHLHWPQRPGCPTALLHTSKPLKSLSPKFSLQSQAVMVSHSLFISVWALCPCSYNTAESDFHIVHCLLRTYYKVELVLFMSSHEDMGFHPLGDDSFIGLDCSAPNTWHVLDIGWTAFLHKPKLNEVNGNN